MEDQFLEKEGIFLLLDLLEVSTLLNDKFTAINIFSGERHFDTLIVMNLVLASEG